MVTLARYPILRGAGTGPRGTARPGATARPRPSARGLVLISLRVLTLGILVLILLNPIRIDRELRPGLPPTAIFLVDGSRSMSLEAPVSRSQATARVIERAGSLLTPDHRPRIQSYRFGRELEALAGTARASAGTSGR